MTTNTRGDGRTKSHATPAACRNIRHRGLVRWCTDAQRRRLNDAVVERRCRSLGATTNQTFDLHLGQVTVNLLEATGKPAQTSNLILTLYPHGNLTEAVGTTIGTASATLQLPAGSYDAFANYPYTSLQAQGALATFQVAAGTASTETINLKLGKIEIQVNDASGQPIDKSGLSASAFPAGKRDAAFFVCVHGESLTTHRYWVIPYTT